MKCPLGGGIEFFEMPTLHGGKILRNKVPTNYTTKFCQLLYLQHPSRKSSPTNEG